MHFAEAELKYRELEEELIRGELSEDSFLAKVGDLRLVDDLGRRWRISEKSGRWLLHDGQQWVFAEPPREAAEDTAASEAEPMPPIEAVVTTAPVTAPSPAEAPAPTRSDQPSPLLPRILAAGLVVLLVVGCLFGGGLASWVFLLRDWGEPEGLPTEEPIVAMVSTYTPGPVTPTYTPTFTPTPSRTPTPTITPIPTDTPIATETAIPTNTPVSTATPTPAPSTPTRQATIAAPTATVTAAPTVVSRTSATPAGPQTYTIKLGDTLSGIASQFGVSTSALAEANGITNAALIRPGQTLVIPGTGTAATAAPTTVAQAATQAQTYKVKVGDTLYGIAVKFGVSANALAEANGITDPARIRPGQVLAIPVEGTTAVASAASSTPTWTPIVLATSATASSTTTPAATAATRTPTPKPTASGPTSTPKPTNTPKPAATATPKPVTLSGKIAFTIWNQHKNKYELYVSQIDGSGRNMLGEGFRQPQFRPDGNLLAVNGDGAQNLEHLVTMNANGGEMRGVSNFAEDSFPTWSADGAIVAYSSSSWGDGRTRVGIVHDMFGPQQEWIRIGNAQVEGEYPFWMADGRVVYHGCDSVRGGGDCGLYWIGAGGGSYHRASTHESDTAPSGAGTRVAFMSARDGNWEIYSADLNGGPTKRLTNNGAQDGLPTWSPDGKSIAFVSNRGGGWAIWVMNADGSDQRKLFDLGGGYGGGEYDWTRERISWAP